MPDRYLICFDRRVYVPEPGQQGWTIEQATAIIARLVEDKKITRKCGYDLIAWANGLSGVQP